MTFGGTGKSPWTRTVPVPVPPRMVTRVRWRAWFSGSVVDVVLVVDVVEGVTVVYVVPAPGWQVASTPVVMSVASA